MSSVGRNLLTYMLRSEISNARMENFTVPSIRNWFSSKVSVKPRRALGGCVETAGRNLVIQIAGSNRQKLRRPNRDVHLRDRYVHFAVVEAVERLERPGRRTGVTSPRKPPGTNTEPRPSTRIRCSRCSRCVQFLRSTRRGQRHQHRPPEHLAPDTAQTLVSPSHTISTNIAIEATSSANLACEVRYRHASGDGNGDAGARSLANTPRMRVFLCDRRAKRPCVFARCVR